MQLRHVTNSHMTCKGSWEMTALSPWEYVNEEVSSLVVTLCVHCITNTVLSVKSYLLQSRL